MGSIDGYKCILDTRRLISEAKEKFWSGLHMFLSHYPPFISVNLYVYILIGLFVRPWYYPNKSEIPSILNKIKKKNSEENVVT